MNYATYNITDDKIRASFAERLSDPDYQKSKQAGFAYWYGSKLFVAKWSTAAVDFLEEMGITEIEDDDQPDDVEARVDRFAKYAENAAKSAEAAHNRVEQITSGIPLGQPIMVGHHSERHARRDAEKIQNGMNKAISETKRAEHWNYRIQAAIRHANYKEQPPVIARRIAKLEAELRRFQREISKESRAQLHARLFCDLRYEMAKEYQNQHPDEWTKEAEHEYIMSQKEPLNAQVREKLEKSWAVREKWAGRWIEHLEMVLQYQRAIYAASGGIAVDRIEVNKGDFIKWRGIECEVVKINQKTITVLFPGWRGGDLAKPRKLNVDKTEIREVIKKENREPVPPVEHVPAEDRLFAGIFPTGISYADTTIERHGDYKRLGFLSFSTLELTIEKDCPKELADQITRDAAKIQAQRGQEYQISTAGQTVILGSAICETLAS